MQVKGFVRLIWTSDMWDWSGQVICEIDLDKWYVMWSGQVIYEIDLDKWYILYCDPDKCYMWSGQVIRGCDADKWYMIMLRTSDT